MIKLHQAAFALFPLLLLNTYKSKSNSQPITGGVSAIGKTAFASPKTGSLLKKINAIAFK